MLPSCNWFHSVNIRQSDFSKMWIWSSHTPWIKTKSELHTIAYKHLHGLVPAHLSTLMLSRIPPCSGHTEPFLPWDMLLGFSQLPYFQFSSVLSCSEICKAEHSTFPPAPVNFTAQDPVLWAGRQFTICTSMKSTDCGLWHTHLDWNVALPLTT